MDYVIREDKGNLKIDLLWIGLILYNIGILLEEFFDVYNVAFFKLFIAFGILFCFFSMYSNLSFNFKNRNGYFRIVVLIMFLWYLFMIVNSDLKKLLSIGSFVMPYSLISYSVFLLLFFKTDMLVRSLFRASEKVNYIFILLFLIPAFYNVNSNFIQLFIETFAFGAAIIFITNKYHSNKNIIISLIVLLVAFLVAALQARRNLMLTTGMYLLIGGGYALINGKLKSIEAKLIVLITGFLILLGSITYYLSESTGIFSKITGRASENTREVVFVSFAADMSNMKDFLFGRGFTGEYYSPGVDQDDVGEYNDYRRVIECGYLQLILNGGVIYLFLYLLLFVGAICMGVSSKNQLMHGSAFMLVVQIIDMVPFGLHAFNFKAFMIWTIVALCYDSAFRKMTDAEVLEELYQVKIKKLPWKKN